PPPYLSTHCFSTDANSAERHGISIRALQRYRKDLVDGNDSLGTLCRHENGSRNAAWADELPSALTKALAALQSASRLLRAILRSRRTRRSSMRSLVRFTSSRKQS